MKQLNDFEKDMRKVHKEIIDLMNGQLLEFYKKYAKPYDGNYGMVGRTAADNNINLLRTCIWFIQEMQENIKLQSENE